MHPCVSCQAKTNANPSSMAWITHLYTADPSAHVFDGRLYVYPSHDIEAGVAFNDNGDQYAMEDYHVFSTASLRPPAPVTDHGVALRLADVPWAARQLWAPDAAARGGLYYLFFPARAHDGRFRIGVAVGARPEGPFAADPAPLAGTYSVDPAVLVDVAVGEDGTTGPEAGDADGENDDNADTAPAYLYFGGLWGGQLQCYARGAAAGDADAFDAALAGPQEPAGPGVAALGPRVARLRADLRALAEPAREVVVLAPETGRPLAADDHARRFFEAPWVHRRGAVYYLSYSTGDTHRVVYATGASPYGPFTFRGELLAPVAGWTTHHSVVAFQGRWFLFYHDASLSGGVSHLRSVKVKELWYDAEGCLVDKAPGSGLE